MTKKRFGVDRGQLVPGRKRDDQIRDEAAPAALAVTISPPFGARAKAATARSISGASRMLTGLTSTLSDGATAWMAATGRSRRVGGIPKDRRSRHARRDLLEQLQPFPADAVFEIHETGGVAARPRQAVDEAGADRIGDDDREHDRHGAGRLQQRRHGRGAMGQNDVRRERDQFRRVSANVGGIGCGPAGVDPHVAADGPAQLRQPLQERPDPGLKFRIVRGCGQEHADAPHPLGLLRARRERPRPPRRREA